MQCTHMTVLVKQVRTCVHTFTKFCGMVDDLCFLPLPLLSLEDIGTSKLPTPICYVDKDEETYVHPKGIILFKTLKG